MHTWTQTPINSTPEARWDLIQAQAKEADEANGNKQLQSYVDNADIDLTDLQVDVYDDANIDEQANRILDRLERTLRQSLAGWLDDANGYAPY